jgi:hypothetical protein
LFCKESTEYFQNKKGAGSNLVSIRKKLEVRLQNKVRVENGMREQISAINPNGTAHFKKSKQLF